MACVTTCLDIGKTRNIHGEMKFGHKILIGNLQR